jgi:hypothetical protein
MSCITAFKQSSIVLAGALILAEGAGLAQLATAQVNLKPVLGPSLPPLGQPFSPHKSVLLASDRQEDMAKKINYYIESCINQYSKSVLESRDRYLEWANATTGPTGKESTLNGVDKLEDPDICAYGVQRAATIKPHNQALEAAADAYQKALVALAPLMNEANLYYKRENYQDDNMAKGRDLHPRLMAAWDAFIKANLELRQQVKAVRKEVDQEQLKKLEAQPRKLHYFSLKASLEAEEILTAASEFRSANDFQLEQFETLVATYEKTVDDLLAYHASHPDQGTPVMFSFFCSDRHENFLVAAKQFLRRRRERLGDNSLAERPSMLSGDGTLSKLRYLYGEIVSGYNSNSIW